MYQSVVNGFGQDCSSPNNTVYSVKWQCAIMHLTLIFSSNATELTQFYLSMGECCHSSIYYAIIVYKSYGSMYC